MDSKFFWAPNFFDKIYFWTPKMFGSKPRYNNKNKTIEWNFVTIEIILVFICVKTCRVEEEVLLAFSIYIVKTQTQFNKT